MVGNSYAVLAARDFRINGTISDRRVCSISNAQKQNGNSVPNWRLDIYVKIFLYSVERNRVARRIAPRHSDISPRQNQFHPQCILTHFT